MRKILISLFAALALIAAAHAQTITGTPVPYATGTWTPTIVGGSVAGTGQTYTSQIGTYEQIGRIAILRFNLIVTSLGTASGAIQIGGLPFAAVTDIGHCYITGYSVAGLAASNFGIMGQIAAGTSLILLSSNGSTGLTNVSNTTAGGTPFFQGTCTYRIS